MSKNNVKRFNKLVNMFLADLHKLLPEEKNIQVFQSQIAVLEMIDPSKILKSFTEFVYPFKDKILNKNEDFFLENGNINVENDYLSDSIHLRDLWKNKFSQKNKDVVWKYFQVMVGLTEQSLAK